MIRFLRVLAPASGTRRAAATASLRSKWARPTAKDIIAQNKPASECLTLFIDVFVQQFKDLRTQIDVSAAASLPPLSKFFVVCESLPTLPTLPFSCSSPLFCLRKTAFKLCISFTPEHLMRFFFMCPPHCLPLFSPSAFQTEGTLVTSVAGRELDQLGLTSPSGPPGSTSFDGELEYFRGPIS